MVATSQEKERIKRELAARLSREKEVRKVVIFGSIPVRANGASGPFLAEIEKGETVYER